MKHANRPTNDESGAAHFSTPSIEAIFSPFVDAMCLPSSKPLPLPGQRVITTLPVNLEKGPLLTSFTPQNGLYHTMATVIAGSTWQTKGAAKGKPYTADVWNVIMRETGLPMAVLLDGCGFHAEPQAIHTLSEELLVFADGCAHFIERCIWPSRSANIRRRA